MLGRFRSNICKPCDRERARNRAREHAQEHRDYSKAYARANPERVKARMESWRAANQTHLKEYQDLYNAKRADSMREYMRQKRLTGEAQAYQREYARRFPEKGAEKRARRRAQMSGVTVESVSRTAIIKRDGRRCYLCGLGLKWREVTLDHVIPLARGGIHTAANLRVACGPCNSRKQHRSLDEYQAYLVTAGLPAAPSLQVALL